MNDYLSYTILNNQSANILIDFVATDMSVLTYFQLITPVHDKMLSYSKVVTEEELGISRDHEAEHKKAWNKHGVKTEFRKDNWGTPFTGDLDFEQKALKMDKNKVIEIMKEVTIAPYEKGDHYLNCVSDLFQYDILTGKQKTSERTKEDRKRMEKEYLNKS